MCVLYSNLPAKPAEEAQKHRQQYEEMVAQAKKRGEVTETHPHALLPFPAAHAPPFCRVKRSSEEEEAAGGSVQA